MTKNKQEIIANYNLIAGTNLYMVVTTPQKQAFMAARDLIITVLTFGAGFLIIGLVLTFTLASRITKPLSELKEVASQIGGGDFKVEVHVKSNDEVGQLASSIDIMKKSLLERDEKIEHSKMALVQSEKMSAFGQLSAGIAHEVKNPLAGILGHAQLAKSKSKDADVTKHLDMIERETRRTKEIIENLMKFARAEKPDLTPTSLFETVSRAVDLVDHQLSLQGIKIIRDFQPTSNVNANSNQVQQVLLNLMMNAGHAMETAKTKELKVSVQDKGEIVQIRIKDSGHGMSPEVQKRIFEPFFTTKPAGKGTGLGLSVSFGIIRDHKAKIYVESKVNEGTTFFIEFPKIGSALAQQQEAAAKAVATATQSAATKSEAPKENTQPLDLEKTLSAKLKKEEIKKDIKDINEDKSSLSFPEFSGKTETALDSQVQRDYLKSSAESVSKNIHDLKKEAARRLEAEKNMIKPAEEKAEKAPEKNIETKIQNIKNEIANTEVEIKNLQAAKPNDGAFKVNIRKPKLKA
jgi:signal transduction histidine kinase